MRGVGGGAGGRGDKCEKFNHVDPVEQLEKAAQLLERGLLTRDEFSLLKAHVLSTHCTDAPVALAVRATTKREVAGDDDDMACAGNSRSAKRPALDDGLQALVKGATHAAMGWWRHVDIFSMSIAPFGTRTRSAPPWRRGTTHGRGRGVARSAGGASSHLS